MKQLKSLRSKKETKYQTVKLGELNRIYMIIKLKSDIYKSKKYILANQMD